MKIKKYEIRKNQDLKNMTDMKVWISSVDVVLVIIYTESLKVSELSLYLKQEELLKSEYYKSITAQINYVTSRAVLNVSLGYILEQKIEDLEILRDQNYKPYVINELGLKFNISHTEGMVLIAFSHQEVGLDVEKINYSFNFNNINESCFRQKEIVAIKNNTKTFFNYWTCKEAYLKCSGTGLLRDLKEIEILLYNDRTIKIIDLADNKIIFMIPLKFDDKYVGVICME